ncbi:transposase [Xylophilus sp. Kf1]|nr:transposase [Xylophilus sp. Kf1]
MARLPRLTVAGQVHRLILRGHNGQPVFGDDADRRLLLRLLQDHAVENAIAVHAYVLLDSQVHLLVTPADERLGAWMQAVGRRYVRHFNDRHHRSGTLWEGRYRSTVLEADAWLQPAMVVNDLAPVAAGLVVEPEAWPWSSHGHYTGRAVDRLVTSHASSWALGNTPFAREKAYADLVHDGVPAEHRARLEAATLGGWALGRPAFLAELGRATPRRLAPGVAGRPPIQRKGSGPAQSGQ